MWSELTVRVREYLTANPSVLADGWDGAAKLIAIALETPYEHIAGALYRLVAQGYIDYDSGVVSWRDEPVLLSEEEVDSFVDHVFGASPPVHRMTWVGDGRRPRDGRPPGAPRR